MAPLEVVGLMAATQALLTHADLHSLRLRSRNGRRFELHRRRPDRATRTAPLAPALRLAAGSC